MIRKLVCVTAAAIIGAIPFSANASGPGNYAQGDYVTQVYACNPHIIFIDTKNNGWFYVYDADVTTTMMPWILSTALELLSTGKQIGWVYEPTGVLQSAGCGMQGVEIEDIVATNAP